MTDVSSRAVAHAKPHRFGMKPRLVDPAGTLFAVEDRDVAKLMTPKFLTDGGIAFEEALRYNALTAMMAFLYVSPGISCEIPMEAWLPDGLDAVRAKRYRRLENVPVCKGAYMVIDRYLREGRRRPPGCVCPTDERCSCGMMFTSLNGRKLDPNNLADGFDRIGAEIGAALPVPDMVLRFCQRKLEEAIRHDVRLEEEADEVAARRFMGKRTVRGPRHQRLPEVDFEDLADLARRAGRWYTPFGRGLGNEQREAELLAEPSAVPAHCPGRRGKARAEPPRLPADHPLVAEIMALEIPEGERKLKGHRRWRRENYFPRIDALVPREMGVPQASELLLIEPTAYRALRQYHVRGGKKRKAEADRGRRRPHVPRARVRPDRTQAATLDRLRHFPWSEDPAERSDQRRDIVPKCFVAVDDMVLAHAIKMPTARRLLDLDSDEWILFRTARKVGFPLDRVLPAGPCPPISPRWRRRVEEAHAARAPEDTDVVIYLRVREMGFEGNWFIVSGICKELRRKTGAVDVQEPGFVALLRDHAWPVDPAETAAESERLLAAHIAEATGLVDARRVAAPVLRDLFRTSEHRFNFLLAALRAGLSVDQAMRPQDRRPLHVDDWRIADRVIRGSRYGEGPRALYFRAVLAGFPGSENQFRAGTARLREAQAKAR